MANLIITVIAIALVAVASLMGAYYGGAAFLNNQSAAGASTVLNQGQQVQGAWSAFLSDNLNSPPTTATQLVTNNYMAQIPMTPAAAGAVQSNLISINTIGSTGHYYAWANVGKGGTGAPSASDSNAAACMRILKTALGGQANNTPANGTPGSIASTASSGNGTFGCAYTTAAVPAGLPGSNANTIPVGNYVMEYVLQ